MMDQLNEVMETILNDEKFLKNTALIIKKLHDELIEVGFSEDAATKICSNYKTTGN